MLKDFLNPYSSISLTLYILFKKEPNLANVSNFENSSVKSLEEIENCVYY